MTDINETLTGKAMIGAIAQTAAEFGIAAAENLALATLAQLRNASGEKAETPRRWLITSIDNETQHNTETYDNQFEAEQAALSRLENDLVWTQWRINDYQPTLNNAEHWSGETPWSGVYLDNILYDDGDEYRLIIVEITA